MQNILCATAYMEISANREQGTMVSETPPNATIRSSSRVGLLTVLHRLADVATRADGMRLVVGKVLKNNEITRQNSAHGNDCLAEARTGRSIDALT